MLSQFNLRAVSHAATVTLNDSAASRFAISAVLSPAVCRRRCRQAGHADVGFQPVIKQGQHTCYAGFGFGAGAKSTVNSKDCPCGSGRQFSDCCQRFLKPKSKTIAPETPEQLIAARYTAFCKRDAKFLKRTNHRSNPALQGSKTADDAGVQKRCTYEEDLAMTFLAVYFTSFKLLGSRSNGSSSATVEYSVTFKRKIDSQGQKIKDPQEEVLHERAEVVKSEDGKWLVLGVEQIPPPSAAAAAAAGAAAASTV